VTICPMLMNKFYFCGEGEGEGGVKGGAKKKEK
jgi:hypothetical protein